MDNTALTYRIRGISPEGCYIKNENRLLSKKRSEAFLVNSLVHIELIVQTQQVTKIEPGIQSLGAHNSTTHSNSCKYSRKHRGRSCENFQKPLKHFGHIIQMIQFSCCKVILATTCILGLDIATLAGKP